MNVAVIGKGKNCPEEVYALARVIGEMVAKAGHVLVTGGLGGVMEAASHGAQSVGGVTLGIVPMSDKANPYVSVVVRSGLPEVARNIITATTADAMVVLYGSHGTLQEIAVARERQIPMVACDTRAWELAPVCLASRTVTEVSHWLADLERLAMVDVVVLRCLSRNQDKLAVLLVKRERPPFTGQWALPGGKIERHEEARHAACRELAEETGTVIHSKSLVPLGRYDEPGRDPRGLSVSHAYAAMAHDIDSGPTTGGTWHEVSALPLPLAFDHQRMIDDAVEMVGH